jgi:hypothetical protein
MLRAASAGVTVIFVNAAPFPHSPLVRVCRSCRGCGRGCNECDDDGVLAVSECAQCGSSPVVGAVHDVPLCSMCLENPDDPKGLS